MRKLISGSLLSAVALLSAGCAQMGGGYYEPTRIELARVISVNQSLSAGGWAPGAAIGGTVGVLSGIGHSTESKVVRGAVGALAGAAINKAFTSGNPENYVIVQTKYGQTYQVRHEPNDLVSGDCVQIESSRGEMRLFRASSMQCNF